MNWKLHMPADVCTRIFCVYIFIYLFFFSLFFLSLPFDCGMLGPWDGFGDMYSSYLKTGCQVTIVRD